MLFQSLLGLFKKTKASAFAVIFCFTAILLARHLTFEPNILSWDTFGYYLYLPAYFIHHDSWLTNISWVENIRIKYEVSDTLYQIVDAANGNHAIKYTPGMALFFLPFFLIAHLFSNIFGYPSDGFSVIYQFSIGYGVLLYALFGLWYLRKVLINYFSEGLTAFLIILVVFGTNFFQMAYQNSQLTHIPLFFLYALFLHHTIQWYKKQQTKNLIIVSASLGLIGITRPPEVIIGLSFLLWNVSTPKGILNNLSTLFNNIKATFLSMMVFGIVISILHIYWKKVSGTYFFDSYNNPGEGFDLWNPYILDFLFSFRKGWLIYTPLSIFMLLGIYKLYTTKNSLLLSIGLPFLLSFWIISSWTCWWYAGASYSARAIIPQYTLLILPLGFWLRNIATKPFKYWGLVSILWFVTFLNLVYTYQFQKNILPGDGVTKSYFSEVFLKFSKNPTFDRLLFPTSPIISNYGPTNEHEMYKKWLTEPRFDSTYMHSKMEYTQGIAIQKGNLTSAPYCYVKGSAEMKIPNRYSGELPLIVFHLKHNGKVYFYEGIKAIPMDTLEDNWYAIQAYYLLPQARSGSDSLLGYIWHRSADTLLIRNVKFESLEPLYAN